MVYWRWANKVHQVASTSKTPLWINMDETTMYFAYASMKGTVLTPAIAKQYSSAATHENISLADTHSRVTWCAFLCNVHAVQTLLPQIILASKKNVSGRLYTYTMQNKPPNIHLWIEDSAWMNLSLFDKMLRLLVRCLSSVAEQYSLILLVDVARCHFGIDIARRALQLGIQLMVVPARLTWLLQPLDTHVFATVKRFMKNALTAARTTTALGRLSPQEWLVVVLETIRWFCVQNFAASFRCNGLEGSQASVRKTILDVLEIENVDCGSSLPDPDELAFYMGCSVLPYHSFLFAQADVDMSAMATEISDALPPLQQFATVVTAPSFAEQHPGT